MHHTAKASHPNCSRYVPTELIQPPSVQTRLRVFPLVLISIRGVISTPLAVIRIPVPVPMRKGDAESGMVSRRFDYLPATRAVVFRIYNGDFTAGCKVSGICRTTMKYCCHLTLPLAGQRAELHGPVECSFRNLCSHHTASQWRSRATSPKIPAWLPAPRREPVRRLLVGRLRASRIPHSHRGLSRGDCLPAPERRRLLPQRCYA